MHFELGTCVLRPWQPGDRDSLVKHANSRQVWRNLTDQFPHPYTQGDADSWLQLNNEPRTPANFAIVVDGEAGGGIGIRLGVDVHRCTAEIGYWLGEEFWGRGIAAEALKTVSDYAFTTHQIVRLEAGVFGWNPRSMRVLEKAGYQREGVLRCAIYKDGAYTDRVMYALVRLPSVDVAYARVDSLAELSGAETAIGGQRLNP